MRLRWARTATRWRACLSPVRALCVPSWGDDWVTVASQNSASQRGLCGHSGPPFCPWSALWVHHVGRGTFCVHRGPKGVCRRLACRQRAHLVPQPVPAPSPLCYSLSGPSSAPSSATLFVENRRTSGKAGMGPRWRQPAGAAVFPPQAGAGRVEWARSRWGGFAIITLNVTSFVCLFARGAGNRPSHSALQPTSRQSTLFIRTAASGQPPGLWWGQPPKGEAFTHTHTHHLHTHRASWDPPCASDTTANWHVEDAGGGGFGNLAAKYSPRELRLLPRISKSTSEGNEASGPSPEEFERSPWRWERSLGVERRLSRIPAAPPPAPALRRLRKRLGKQRAAVSAQG